MIFFFSSRRRHTRCSRDWSSDVCSSDLDDRRQVLGVLVVALGVGVRTARDRSVQSLVQGGGPGERRRATAGHQMISRRRSEERRVGKELRSGRVACPVKRKNATNYKCEL